MEELKKEINANQNNKRVFFSIDTKCKGVVFIKLNPMFKEVIDVKKLANIIMKDVHENKAQLSRYCFKLVPIEYAARANTETFKTKIIEMLSKKFPQETAKKWLFHFKCRNNDKFGMKPFLEIIQENIGKLHSVDYKNPEYTVFVEISQHLMCMSILKKFQKFNNYSLNTEKYQGETKVKPQQSNVTSQDKKVEGENEEKTESQIGHLEFEEKVEPEKVSTKVAEPEEDEEDISLI